MSSPEEIRDTLRYFPRRGIRRWGSRRRASARVAAAITVVTDGSTPAVLLRRAGALPEHAGRHLPGAPIGPDEAASDAARRALREELGMPLPPESVLGLLDDYETRSGFVITPVVVWAGRQRELPRSRATFLPTHVVAVPFAELDVEPVFVAGSADSGVGEPERPVIRLPLHGEWLHAPTAALLYQFREVVLRRRPTRVAHLQASPLITHSAGSAGLFGRR